MVCFQRMVAIVAIVYVNAVEVTTGFDVVRIYFLSIVFRCVNL